MTASAREQYRETCDAYEAEFARNRELHGERIHCRAGCSDCCSQLFQITEIEAAALSAGVRSMPAEKRRRLEERAKPYVAERAKLLGATGEPEAWGNLPREGTRLACPALEDGVCQVYEHRPLICRKFGMPLWNPDKPGRVYACELNFRPGEEIEDGRLIQIQTGLHGNWKGVQRAYNERGGRRDPAPITVARAILEDFSDWTDSI